MKEHVGFRIDKDLIYAVNDPIHHFKGSISERKKEAFVELAKQGFHNFQFFDDDQNNLDLVKTLETEYYIKISTIKANKKHSF
jgi:hypothetical protein